MMNQDEKWMRMALTEARYAEKEGEVPVGAVIVRDGSVIGVGHNRCISLCDATAHAECRAISMASHAIGSWRLEECTMYVTLEPCPMCAGAAINARIGRIVYGVKDPRMGACESLIALPSYPLEHRPICVSGVLEHECRDILQAFFSSIREQNNKDRKV